MPHQVQAAATAEHVFFQFQGRYIVAPGVTLSALLGDGHSLLSSALATFEMIGQQTDADFAVLHLLRQALAVISLADDMAERLHQGVGA